MAQRPRQPTFDYNGDIADPEPAIKNLKTCKTKFMKDLNHKSNVIIRSEKNNKLNENSRQKDFILNKQRTRRKSELEMVQMKSLLQKVIPGAKITKGEWKDHKLHGIVQISYDNGNEFIGKYQNGVRVEGKMTYPDLRCEYEGSFFAEKFSGYGKLSYQGGRTIEGQWDNMEFVGNATITYPNKDVYYGPVDEKLYKHGKGYLFLQNGYKYVGNFKQGSISGIGSYYKDDIMIKKGHWFKGKLIKQLGIDQQTQGQDGSSNPQPELDISPMIQSSGAMFSYRFKEKDEINYSPKQSKSMQSSDESSQSFLSIKPQQKHQQRK